MTATAIMKIAMAFGATTGEARLVDAIAAQESSRQLHPSGYNDGGKAFGLFQFHADRWSEYSKAEWGEATAKQQIEAMVKVIKRQVRRSKGRITTRLGMIIWVGRYHNIGHCLPSQSHKHTKYTKSVLAHFQENLKHVPKPQK